MLEEKKVWDVIDETRSKLTTVAQTRKKVKDNAVALKIIKQGVHFAFYTNIIGECDLNQSQKSLQRICSQIGQGIVYSILKELLNYLQVAKPFEYKKKATTIFAEGEIACIAPPICSHGASHNLRKHNTCHSP